MRTTKLEKWLLVRGCWSMAENILSLGEGDLWKEDIDDLEAIVKMLKKFREKEDLAMLNRSIEGLEDEYKRLAKLELKSYDD